MVGQAHFLRMYRQSNNMPSTSTPARVNKSIAIPISPLWAPEAGTGVRVGEAVGEAVSVAVTVNVVVVEAVSVAVVVNVAVPVTVAVSVEV